MVNPARKDNHSSSSSSQETLLLIEQDLAASSSTLDVPDDELALLLLLTGPPLILAARLYYELGHRAGLEHIGRTMIAWKQAAAAVPGASGIPLCWLRNAIRESQDALEQQQQELATSEAVARPLETSSTTSTPPPCCSPSSSHPSLTKRPMKSYKSDETSEERPSPPTQDRMDGESWVPECDPYNCYNCDVGKDGCLICKSIARHQLLEV